MRIARWVLGIAGAVVLLAVATVLVATLVINPDRYKGEIESAVRRETGRPFALEGHLRLTWYPWLGVRTGTARLGNLPGTGGPDLLDWQSAAVRVRLLPLLLHHQLEVGRVRIVGADIHLRRGPHGHGSWDDLLARLRSRQTRAMPASARGGSASTAWPATLAGLDLEKSSLEYVDERSHEHVRLAGWKFVVGPYRAGKPLSVRTSFVLHVDGAGQNASAAGIGALRLPAAGVRVSFEAPRLQLHPTPFEISAPQWSLQLADAKLQGAIDASRDAAGVVASGSLKAAVPSLRTLAHALGVGIPTIRDPAALGALALSASWSDRNGALEVEPLAAKLDSTRLTGWIARSRSPKPQWTFALRANQVDFGHYLTRSGRHKPLELPLSALQALRAQGTLRLGRARIHGVILSDVRLQVR